MVWVFYVMSCRDGVFVAIFMWDERADFRGDVLLAYLARADFRSAE